MAYIQKSNFTPQVNSNNNENNMFFDIRYLIQAIEGASIYVNGFRITSCLEGNILLPENSTVEYTGPLTLCPGATLTIPSGTTLTIV
jgi:hypothetical protein